MLKDLVSISLKGRFLLDLESKLFKNSIALKFEIRIHPRLRFWGLIGLDMVLAGLFFRLMNQAKIGCI